MPSEPVPDLFDFLRAEYLTWDLKSEVLVSGAPRQITLPTVPNGELERFAAFSREYLRINPISLTGQVGADFGVTLTDGRRFAIARGSSRSLDQQNGGYSVSGGPGYFDLPPAYAVQVTSGG